MTIRFGIRVLAVLGGMMTLAACASYPAEPRYSIHADGSAPPPSRAPASTIPPLSTVPAPSGEGVRGATNPADEVPPPRPAPVEAIEGGVLSAPVNTAPRAYAEGPTPAAGPASEGFSTPPPPRAGAAAVEAGAVYEIQPGDTISGIGRRFQTPVQNLIDLNALGPRAAITPGQRLILPSTAVDIGGDPYATGPSPAGVYVPEAGTPPPPPPPPPSGNAALPPPPREPAATAGPVSPAPAASTVSLDWPVRGDILRRFGPVGMGERNNGVNIGAAAGTEVRAAAAGEVAYVGDDLAGQGLTVLVAHPGGWRTVYGHLGSTVVRDGDRVTAGQQIGTVGTTAGDGRPSVHFETWRMRGLEPNAVDPLTVLPR
ncbi:peptidoglycan DD-metalloendopeptidase family protein [Brevundimonas sp.]|uniref:peptidoglycan DD-metalloendopeptidase family protein n=1 Tax=Brevundimonas sp. TaxID=1871086 RepID=UPI002C893CA5|nr:peptidoglycan DD-metalloendopeptidase family protein [Brevundimonas sp.]HWQ86145.1 peptidoglycan DD-metalloendopeptidase family protein [Brevundimonas sp.]